MSLQMMRKLEGPPRGFSKAYRQQLAKRKNDADFQGEVDQVELLNKVNEVAMWHEHVADKVAYKKYQSSLKQMKGELGHAARAAVMVRRAALKNLLTEEYAMYEREFNALGETFYKQRI